MPVPAQNNPILRITTKEIILKSLYQWIVDGTFKPGEKISDMELANYFSTSRTPVREAFQVLSEQKLVDVIPGQGTYIAPINRENTRQVYQMLSNLHAMAVELAWPSIDQTVIEKMESAQEAFVAATQTGSLFEVEQADAQFHGCLVDLSQNEYLTAFINQLSIQVYRVEHLCFEDITKRTSSSNTHQDIIQAIKKGDLECTKNLVKKNWMSFYTLLES